LTGLTGQSADGDPSAARSGCTISTQVDIL